MANFDPIGETRPSDILTGHSDERGLNLNSGRMPERHPVRCQANDQNAVPGTEINKMLDPTRGDHLDQKNRIHRIPITPFRLKERR